VFLDGVEMISGQLSIGQKSGGLAVGADCMQLNLPHDAFWVVHNVLLGVWSDIASRMSP
jgi:hypothetical protein